MAFQNIGYRLFAQVVAQLTQLTVELAIAPIGVLTYKLLTSVFPVSPKCARRYRHLLIFGSYSDISMILRAAQLLDRPM